jgi:hypothetical protein
MIKFKKEKINLNTNTNMEKIKYYKKFKNSGLGISNEY